MTVWDRGIEHAVAPAAAAAATEPAPTAWRVQRRTLVLLGALASFIAIFVARRLSAGVGDSLGDALGLLYVLPIALVSLELGLRAGLIAASAVIVVDLAWMQAHGRDLDAVSMFVRAGIFLLAAGLTGGFSERMRGRLREQVANAGRLIAEQEHERRHIATQLHEEAAQTLAAALLTVSMLERRAGAGDLDTPQLEVVREHVKSCIADLRRIAAPLRPDVLDEMGLASAAERLAERESCEGRRIEIAIEPLPPGLSREFQSLAYRLLEEMVRAPARASSIMGSLQVERSSLRIALSAAFSGAPERDGALDAALAAARARAQLSGGTLRVEPFPGGARIVALLPLRG